MARTEEIIKLVSQHRKIEVKELSKLLNVTDVTIRKDLVKLEEKGIISREHGFAVINNTDNLNFRLAQHHDLKRKIAKKAAEIISDGETIMIESGSTCALLAEEISEIRKNVTIITNSLFIASYIRKSNDIKVILLGGEYQNSAQVTVGPLIKKITEEFYVDKLFVGLDGFDEKRGFRSNDIARSEATQAMAGAAKKVIVLTDASKFEQNSIITEFSFDEVAQVFTDKGLPLERQDFLEKEGIKVVTV